MAKASSIQTHQWLILLTVIVGTFLGRLDQTIVNLALPKIIQDFSITVTSAGWIATAYILANAIFVPIWGKLGDTIGRKKVYLTGFIIFILGSVLAGLSWNLNSMIIFRVIQAIASSADYPTAMAIIAVSFPDAKQRIQALGLWSASFAAAAVFGPLIGGPLIDNFSWRAVFLINLPVGLIGLILAIIFVKESVSNKKSLVFDWWGAITLGISLSALVLVLDRGVDWGWLSASSLLAYAVTLLFALIFIKIEHNISEPIVDLKFFKIGTFVNTLLNNFVVFMGMMGGIFLIPIFASTYLGLNATETGLLFMPMAAMMMIASPLGGHFAGKVQPRYIIALSTAVAALGLFLFSFLDPKATSWDIIFPLSVMAFGLGFGMAQRTSLIAAIVPEQEVGIASSVLALVRNIAGAFGIAIFGTILNSATESNVLKLAAHSAINTTDPAMFHQFVALIILKAQVLAYSTVFRFSALIVLVGAALALLIKVEQQKHGAKVIMID